MAREISRFLDHLEREREREKRNADAREIRQYKGLREEWSAYLEDNIDNL